MTGPLQGIRILDLTNVLAGPFCCHQLAHMGAEVIKVEVPGSGDLARQLGADPELNERLMGVSFLAQNPGKKSVTINLKSDKGKDLFKKLTTSADVVVENFRPGVMDRLSVGFDTLKKVQPTLVYCAISGFGQDGPMCNLPAYDQIIQGLSGIMDITGAPATAPYRVGYPVADTVGGITAAFAIAAALAEKNRTEPRFIDVSMLESVMATMGWAVSNWLVAGTRPVPRGNDNMTASPSGTFTTGDGLLNLAANKQEQFEAVCDVLDVPELKTDPAFARRQNRLDNRAALTALLEDAMASGSARHWCDRLNGAGVPAGEVLSVPDALDLPQISDRGMIGAFEAVPGVDRDVQLLRTGIKLDGQAPAVDLPPPELGQDNLAVFAELGLSADDVARLKQENII